MCLFRHPVSRDTLHAGLPFLFFFIFSFNSRKNWSRRLAGRFINAGCDGASEECELQSLAAAAAAAVADERRVEGIGREPARNERVGAERPQSVAVPSVRPETRG